MSSDELIGSVTQWIQDVKLGEGEAAQRLWDRYFSSLVNLAHRKMYHVPKQESDEEDVVVQALSSFFDGAKRGQFPQLADRNDLWSLLASIVEHKAHKVRSRHAALKRGGGKVRVDLNLDTHPGRPSFPSLDELSLGLRELMGVLNDDQLCDIVVLIFHGHTNAEIAAKLEIHERTVERRRMLVRKRWEAEL